MRSRDRLFSTTTQLLCKKLTGKHEVDTESGWNTDPKSTVTLTRVIARIAGTREGPTGVEQITTTTHTCSIVRRNYI